MSSTNGVTTLTARIWTTRDRLYEAAEELIVEQGYDTTTMAEIAARAGTSRRTAFNHFASKRDIAVEWAARRRARARAAIDLTDAPPLERLRSYFVQMAQITESEPELTHQMMFGWLTGAGPVTMGGPWLTDDLLDILEDFRSHHPALEGVPAQALLNLISDTYAGVIYRWMRSARAAGEFARQLREGMDLVLAGVELLATGAR